MGRERQVLCIELLQIFSKNELKNLEKMLSWDFFNTDRWVEKLFKTLKKNVLKSGVFDDKMQCKVFREAFDHLPAPKGILKKNERSWLNQNLNKLMRLAELFLSIQQLKSSDDYKCELLYPELLAREQYKSFNRHIKKDKAALDKKDNKGAEYYAQKYKIEKAIFNYLHQNGRLIKEDNLPDLIQNLDMCYALDKLDIHITALSMRYVPGKGKYDLSSMEATAPLLDLPQYVDSPLIMLYRTNIALIKTESETAYYDLLNLLDGYELVVPLDVLKGFYTSAANYCAGEIRRGKSEYNNKMFELYKIMDDKKLLIDGGFITAIKLKNMVTMGCRVEEYEWATNVIERYRLYIREEIRDSVYHLNLGNIAFHQKDYATAHREFILVGKVDKTYEINVKVVILKCLYEEDNATPQTFRSTEKFFKENKLLPPKDKRGYINFVKTLTLIYHLRHNVNKTKADIERVKEKLNTQELNSDKRWLLEKIEELEEGIK